MAWSDVVLLGVALVLVYGFAHRREEAGEDATTIALREGARQRTRELLIKWLGGPLAAAVAAAIFSAPFVGHIEQQRQVYGEPSIWSDSVQVSTTPSAVTPLFTESFETGGATTIPGVVGNWDPWVGQGFDSVTYTNGGQARTGSWSVVMAASGVGTERGGFWFQVTAEPEEMWFEFWEYVPINWYMNGDHQQKWIGIYGGVSVDAYGENPASSKFITAMWPQAGATEAHIEVGAAFTHECDGPYTGPPGEDAFNLAGNTTAWTPAEQGTWRRWRYHVKSGEGNGVAEVWVDNTKLVDFPSDISTACDSWTGNRRVWRYVRMTWAQDDNFPEAMNRYFDDITVWDQDPGWTFN